MRGYRAMKRAGDTIASASRAFFGEGDALGGIGMSERGHFTIANFGGMRGIGNGMTMTTTERVVFGGISAGIAIFEVGNTGHSGVVQRAIVALVFKNDRYRNIDNDSKRLRREGEVESEWDVRENYGNEGYHSKRT